MKRIKVTFITLIAFLGIHEATHAQLSVTPEAGITAVNRVDMSNWTPSFKVGASVEYTFNDFFSLQSGLHYTKRDNSYNSQITVQKIDGSGEQWTYSLYSNHGYLQLPVKLKIGWDISDDVRLFIGAGAYVGYRVGASDNSMGYYLSYGYGYGYSGYGEYGYGGYGYGNITGYSVSGNQNKGYKWDWGTTFSAGIEAKKWVMSVGYDLALGKESQFDSVGAKFHTISMTLGYKFKL